MTKKKINTLVINEFFGMYTSSGWRSMDNFTNNQKVYTKIVADVKFLERPALFLKNLILSDT